LAAISAFQIESQSPLRSCQLYVSPEGNVREIFWPAAGNRSQQGLVRRRVDFTDAVVGQTLGKLPMKLAYRASSPLLIWGGMGALLSLVAALSRI